MARLSATDRRMFDAFNACPWNTENLRISYAAAVLVRGGMKQEDADQLAADAHKRWQVATKPTEPN